MNIFPDAIINLPEADVQLAGVEAYLSQGNNHQIVYMQFGQDVDLPEHSHDDQYAVVLEGRIELIIDGVKNIYSKGDRYFIPKGIPHSGKIYAGYADITFYNEQDRFHQK